MTRDRLMHLSERWFTLLQRLYPPDFRDEMGVSVVEAYMDRARDAMKTGDPVRLAVLWMLALTDSIRNGAAERVRPAASWRRGGNWGRDIEMVTRRLVRAPAFVMATVGTLTIGLGMFAVVYTAAQRILIDPMPYKDPGDLYYVWRDYGPIADMQRGAVGGTDIAELQKAGGIIEDAAGVQRFLGGIFSVREGADPMEIAVTRTSPNLFTMLGVAPALGRGFTPDEIGRAREQVIVLTHSLWNRLGADPEIVGSVARLQSRPFTVIGVLPPEFVFVRNEPAGPPQPVEAFIPLAAELAQTNANPEYAAVIRARRGESPEQVAAAVGAVGRAVDARDFKGRGLKLYPVGLKADVVARIRPALVVLGGAGVVLLFMVMVNLASVLLARAAQREHEVAVSRALGANTMAIVRSTLVEGALLGAAGGALGTLAAVWGTRALVAVAPLDLPRREALAIDWRIGVTVIAIGGLLGMLAAMVPAVWASRQSLSTLLAASAVRGGGGHGRLRRGMIVAQVALSLVLLSSGALVVRSFEQLLRADPGFRSEGVFTIRLRRPPEFFPQMKDVIGFQVRVQEALAAIPGVTAVSAATALPLSAATPQIPIRIPGAPGNTGDADRDTVLTDLVPVAASYVDVMGMRLVAGRTFTEALTNGVNEALIDSALARRFFPDGNAVGATIPLDRGRLTIVGVVDQARMYEVHADGRPQILVRIEDFGARALSFVIRSTREPRSLLPDVRAAIRRTDPRVPVADARSMDEIVDQALSPQKTGAALISAFAIGALLLAAMGLYGVVSGSVTRRRHELAVRLALGADHGRVVRLVLREGATLVALGVLIGAPGIYIAGSLIRGVLVGVSPSDPPTLAGVALGLLLVTLATCYVPARRATGIDPAKLLRQE
jgi:putative ABC transport system permease protein